MINNFFMSEIVVDKLVQKVSNMLEEISEVNLLIRRLTSTQETMNRINERMDALHGVLRQLEKGVTLDEMKLQQLETQTQALGEGLEALKKMTEDQAKAANHLKQVIGSELAKLSQLVERLETATHSIGSVQNQGFANNDKWWLENNEKRKEVFVARIVGMVILLVVLVLLIHRQF
jgi:chromosome segregation ATPase